MLNAALAPLIGWPAIGWPAVRHPRWGQSTFLVLFARAFFCLDSPFSRLGLGYLLLISLLLDSTLSPACFDEQRSRLTKKSGIRSDRQELGQNPENKGKMRFFSRKHQQPQDDNDEQPPTDSSESKGDLNKIAAENDVAASANQAAGTAWLAGHLNHLTPEQEKKLVEFKALVEEKGYYKPGKEDGEIASHSDATLLFVHPVCSTA
jgi:hypothetical protein